MTSPTHAGNPMSHATDNPDHDPENDYDIDRIQEKWLARWDLSLIHI